MHPKWSTKASLLGSVSLSNENYPYRLLIDGLNDSGKEKMNPLTVKVFLDGSVIHMFLDMYTTSGKSAATAETIFSKMDAVVTQHGIPWVHCVTPLVNNTALNIGSRNSLSTRIRAKYPQVQYAWLSLSHFA